MLGSEEGSRKSTKNGNSSASYPTKSISAQTCDEDLPRLITQVTTTIAPIPDRHALPEAHAVLEQRELLAIRSISSMPATSMQRRWLRARLPIRSIWWAQLPKIIAGRAREHNGYALTDFSIDWEHEQARCPQGQTSSSWTPTWTRNQEIIKITFGFAVCAACPVRSQCTRVQATKSIGAAARSTCCLRGCPPTRAN
jgi:Transposase DDE domain